MSDLLLIDFNNLLHRGYSVHSHLEYGGKSTGAIFGFISQLSTLLSNFPTNNIIVCSDGPPYLRSERFPEYKARRRNRERDPEEEKKKRTGRRLVLDFIELANIPFWEEKGLEADDLIAAACDLYHKEFDRIIIVSNDDDLCQLFKYKNVYLKPKKGLRGIKDFEEEYPAISLEDWLKILAMAGTHNDLPGIKGVGIKTALKKIKDKKEYKKFYKENKKLLDLFYELIKLPYHNDLDPPPPNCLGFSNRSLIMFLAGLGIKYTHSMQESFDTIQGEN